MIGIPAAAPHEANGGPFEQFTAGDVRDLIAEFPLAWVFAPGGSAEGASLLPMIAETDRSGDVIRLIGHLSRRNPLYPAMAASGRAVFLFTGPQAYVSPSQVGDRSWAPTWNYAQLRIEADVAFDPPCTDEAVDILVAAMERDRPEPWLSAELGDRYQGMTSRIIGFKARVTGLVGRFKLGQDEKPGALEAIIESAADPALRRWMIRFRDRRGEMHG